VKLLYKIKSVPQKKNIYRQSRRYDTHILGNGRVLSIDPKIYKQSILVLTLHLECFCAHQQRIVLQKDLFQPQKFVFGIMKRFLLLPPGTKFLNTTLIIEVPRGKSTRIPFYFRSELAPMTSGNDFVDHLRVIVHNGFRLVSCTTDRWPFNPSPPVVEFGGRGTAEDDGTLWRYCRCEKYISL
jgi:hypothetical protein